MTVNQLKKELDLKVLAQGNASSGGMDKEINSCYISDLLSRVLGRSKAGDVWITVQTSKNMIAVAVMVEAACVILPEWLTAPDDIVEIAESEGLPLFSSGETAYELAVKISALLL